MQCARPTHRILLGPCTVRSLNALICLFYIQQQKKPIYSLTFRLLFEILPIQKINFHFIVLRFLYKLKQKTTNENQLLLYHFSL